ncbi:MAG: arginine--tRNA ligase [Chloroflexi bacterium]|nr:arginine--tRNA ligase [Chloroflexota bacterium]
MTQPTSHAAPSLRAAGRIAIETAWQAAIRSGALPPVPPDAVVPTVEVEHPADPSHGDLASNLAMKLARPLRRPPLAIAEAIATELRTSAGDIFASVEVAAPGFLNLRLSDAALERALDVARTADAGFGRLTSDQPRKVDVEFVSANPTGPLTVGNARGAFVGDLLCRVLEAAGQDVTREYYFNDSGAQIEHLGASVAALKRGEPVPEDGYHGAYVEQLASDVPADVWAAATSDGAEADKVLGAWASVRVRHMIEASLERLGVRFDVWKSEASLHDEGWVSRAVERLREGGHVYEADGATWFRSTTFGDDKDRVIHRSDGRPTYFAADIGYVTEKFSRGFDHLIYIWGVDHHGTIARNKNAAQAMGFDPDHYEVLLVGWVRFVMDGVEVSMSKRAGTFVTLDDLLDAVGVDAARWFFASRAAHVAFDFDIEQARAQSADNPVYYVQYAHARICSILRKAAEAGIVPASTFTGTLDGDTVAQGLAREVLRLPEVVEDAAAAQATHGVTAYATGLATVFHGYYRDRRVVDPADPATSAARLALVDAARLALRNTLGLLGISTPEQM